MINAREALKITAKSEYEKEKERIKKLLISSATDFGYSICLLGSNEYLPKILDELGCVYNKEKSVVALTQYSKKDSFMEDLVLDVERNKRELLEAVETEIIESAEKCNRSTVFSVANKYQSKWVMNKLLSNNFEVSLNQEDDMIISW